MLLSLIDTGDVQMLRIIIMQLDVSLGVRETASSLTVNGNRNMNQWQYLKYNQHDYFVLSSLDLGFCLIFSSTNDLKAHQFSVAEVIFLRKVEDVTAETVIADMSFILYALYYELKQHKATHNS